MSETKNPGEKKLTLTLKPRTETGVVRQSFSHGRTKQVVVEKIKRRTVGGPAEAKAEPAPVEAPKKVAAAPAPKAPPAPETPKSGVVLRTLTEEEMAARASALADSRVREAEERKAAEAEAKRRASKEGIEQAEREAAAARKREEDARHKVEEESKRKAGEVAKKRLGDDEVKKPAPGVRPKLEAEAAIIDDDTEPDDSPAVSYRIDAVHTPATIGGAA